MCKCRNCENIKQLMNEDGMFHWCDEIIDCPDLDMERNCRMYVEAKPGTVLEILKEL